MNGEFALETLTDDSVGTAIDFPFGYTEDIFQLIGSGRSNSTQYRLAKQEEMNRLRLHIEATRARCRVLLLFCIDRTYSMSSYIAGARDCAKKIARIFKDDWPSSTLMFSAVMYGDELCLKESERIGHVVLAPTEDFDTFKLFLDGIRADCGGDAPEDIAEAYTLMTEVLRNQIVRSQEMGSPWVNESGKVDTQVLVYHILDAVAHGYDRHGDHDTQAQRDRYLTCLDTFIGTTQEYQDFEYHHFDVSSYGRTMQDFCMLTRDSMVRQGYPASQYQFEHFNRRCPDGTIITFENMFAASAMSSIGNSISRSVSRGSLSDVSMSMVTDVPTQLSHFVPFGLSLSIPLAESEEAAHVHLKSTRPQGNKMLMYNIERRAYASKFLAEGKYREGMAAVCAYAENTDTYINFLMAKKAMDTHGLLSSRKDENTLLIASQPFGQGTERNVYRAIIFETPRAAITTCYDSLTNRITEETSEDWPLPPLSQFRESYVVKFGIQNKRIDLMRKQE